MEDLLFILEMTLSPGSGHDCMMKNGLFIGNHEEYSYKQTIQEYIKLVKFSFEVGARDVVIF